MINHKKAHAHANGTSTFTHFSKSKSNTKKNPYTNYRNFFQQFKFSRNNETQPTVSNYQPHNSNNKRNNQNNEQIIERLHTVSFCSHFKNGFSQYWASKWHSSADLFPPVRISEPTLQFEHNLVKNFEIQQLIHKIVSPLYKN